MAESELDVRIDEMVVKVPGRDHADGRAVAEALMRELRALPPLPRPRGVVKIAKLDLKVQMRAGDGPREIAQAVARTLHAALAKAATSAPAEGPPADLTPRQIDEGERIVVPPPRTAPLPTTHHRIRRPAAPPPRPEGPYVPLGSVPPAPILAEHLLAGDLTPAGLADLFQRLPPLAAEARALELLRALDAEVALVPPADPLPPRAEQARQAATATFTTATNRRAAQEIGRLTPVLRQGIIDGLPGHRITAAAWDPLKALLLAQFGTLARAETFYAGNIATERVFGQRVRAHKVLIGALAKAEAKLKRDLGPGAEVHVTIGGLVVRTIAGTNRLSLHAGGLAVDVSSPTNPLFKERAFQDLKTAARIITGSDQSLEPFARLLSTAAPDGEATGDAGGDLLKAAKDLLEATKKIEAVLSDDNRVAEQIAAMVKDAGSGAPADDLAEQALPLIGTAAPALRAAISAFLEANLPSPPSSKLTDDTATLLRMRHARAGKAFFILNLPAQFIVALMSPEGGNLRWLGAAHDRKDYMHFEIKNGRNLLRR
ncbi:MAG TPA: hypothetical protein VHO06_19260 [Polyangia bacterium]|nr:hypothetical protein [Polyangia bacterium]